MKNLDLATKIYYNSVVFAMAMNDDWDYSTEHLYDINFVANVELFQEFVNYGELDEDELFNYCLDDNAKNDEDIKLYHNMHEDLEEHGFSLV